MLSLQPLYIVFDKLGLTIKSGLLLCLASFIALSVIFSSANAQQSGESVNVRSADHPTFSRIVFDWQEIIPYSTELNGTELIIRFDRAASFNFGRLTQRPLRFFGSPTAKIEGQEVVVALEVREPSRLKHFRDGTKIAVDLIEKTVPQALAAQPKRATETLDQKAQKIERAARVLAGDQLKKDDLLPMPMAVSKSGEILSLDFPYTGSAAAFMRGEHIWIVFDKLFSVDQTQVEKIDDGPIIEARQVEHENATVLRYHVKKGHHLQAALKDQGWHFEIKKNLTVPRVPVPVGLQRGSGQGDQFFLSANKVGQVIKITDPDIGDELTVVPLGNSSQGVVRPRQYSQFTILSTAQGIALQLLADDISANHYRNGVGLASAGELAVTKGKLSNRFAAEGEDGQNDYAGSGRLIDLEAWKRGPLPDGDFTENKHELLYRLAIATEEERNQSRWNLARFYLGHGFAADALGPLMLMREDDPELEDSPEYRAVLAIAQVHLRRYDSALKLLSHQRLNAELDAYLWKTIAYEAMGQYPQALLSYERGVDILSLYPIRQRAAFQLAALRAAYAAGNAELMQQELSVLEQMPLPNDQYTQVEYWRARLYQQEGDWDRASELLEKVVRAGERQTAALAQYTMINAQHLRDELSSLDAIDQMERLRFAWRGDRFELDLLYRLGELYIEEKEFRTGFETLRQAATYFAKSSKTRDITKLMSDIYRDLFLDGQADILPPVKAMALYYDFRELTPLGADGDKMIRRLADRLVAVDLLERAAGLLEHQVKHRLKGVAQADIASRLAMIYILDSKPDKALGILMATRHQQIPNDVAHRRDLIEARALIELGRYEEAEILLEEKQGRDVELLRADIYWGAENWSEVVRNAEKLLSSRDNKNRDLSQDERRTLMREAVAMALDENSPGLRQLRQRYWPLMQGGLYAEAFDLITSKPEEGPQNVRILTESIASVDKLEGFMESYKNEFNAGL
ncbi:MAG: hypothetical protein CMF31_10795 [Kordiimonas sp.]|nr:hypothetical protein [Kordiimonas sp.]